KCQPNSSPENFFAPSTSAAMRSCHINVLFARMIHLHPKGTATVSDQAQKPAPCGRSVKVWQLTDEGPPSVGGGCVQVCVLSQLGAHQPFRKSHDRSAAQSKLSLHGV